MPIPLPSRPGVALLVLTAVLPMSVRADTHWRCELSRDLVRLVCRADLAQALSGDDRAVAQPAASSAPTSPAPTAQVNGTRFPLDPLRPWTVDLWSPPTERDRVELLARATICYRSPGCTVSVAWPQDLASR